MTRKSPPHLPCPLPNFTLARQKFNPCSTRLFISCRRMYSSDYFTACVLCGQALFLMLPNPTPHRFRFREGWISLSEQLRTYPSPDPTLTLTCYQLPVVGLGEGWVCSCTETDIDPFPLQLMTRAVREGEAWTWAIGTRKWCIVASCVNNTEVFFSCFVSKWHQYCLREEIDLH